jgi:hypothetical protein
MQVSNRSQNLSKAIGQFVKMIALYSLDRDPFQLGLALPSSARIPRDDENLPTGNYLPPPPSMTQSALHLQS